MLKIMKIENSQLKYLIKKVNEKRNKRTKGKGCFFCIIVSVK